MHSQRPSFTRAFLFHNQSPTYWLESRTRTGTMKKRSVFKRFWFRALSLFTVYLKYTGRCRVSAVLGRNGHFGPQFQALRLWLPGSILYTALLFLFTDSSNQICRFCWHHIKENLNKRCPACRRVYTDEGVEFKPISPQECVYSSSVSFLWRTHRILIC